MRIFSANSGLDETMERSEATRSSIFPSSNSASLWTAIQRACSACWLGNSLRASSHPACLLSLLVGKQFAGQFPEVLTCVIKVDDLNRAGEVLLGNIPDPFRSIAYDDLLFGAVPTALAGFQIEAQTKLLRRFNRTNVGSRAGIAEGKAFLIPCRLRKHASQLSLPRVGRLPFRLACSAQRFLFHYGHSRPVQLHIQDWDRLSNYYG